MCALKAAGVRDQTSNAPSSRWKAATTASSRSSILKVTPTLSFAAAAHLITPRSPSRRHSLLRPLGCVAPSFCASALAVSLPHLSAAAPLARSCPVFTTTPEARAVRAFQSRDASLCCELRPHRDGDAVEALQVGRHLESTIPHQSAMTAELAYRSRFAARSCRQPERSGMGDVGVAARPVGASIRAVHSLAVFRVVAALRSVAPSHLF